MDRLVVRSLVSPAILASISLVKSKRVRAMPSALDRALDTLASISWRASSADRASKGTLARGTGVGVGFASEAEACWPGAVPPPETKTKLITKTIRFASFFGKCLDTYYHTPLHTPFLTPPTQTHHPTP